MPKLALQASLCYNQRVNIVALAGACDTALALINLYRRSIMDTIVPQDDTPYKRCTNPNCENPWLPATAEYFYPHKECKGGLRPECKQCVCARVKAYKLAYPEEYIARSRADYKVHAADRRAKQLLYMQTHPDQHREWSNAHVEEQRAYRRLHADDIRTRTRNRFALKKAAKGTHTAQQIREQYERQKGRCYYCQQKVKWSKHHVDHVIPLSRGGSNDISNLVIACPTCNLSKNDRLPHEWPKGGRLL